MKWQTYVAVVLISILVVCASDHKLPHSTRTGKILDIKIGETVNSQGLGKTPTEVRHEMSPLSKPDNPGSIRGLPSG